MSNDRPRQFSGLLGRNYTTRARDIKIADESKLF